MTEQKEEAASIVRIRDPNGAVSETSLDSTWGFLPKALVNIVALQGWVRPSLIQAATIPLLAKGFPVIAQAATGSGKTGAYVLGFLQRLDPQQLWPQVLVVCPTRELSQQVATVTRTISKDLNIVVHEAIKFDSPSQYSPGPVQAHVVVGTPGSICALLRLRKMDPKRVVFLCLDEADNLITPSQRKDISGSMAEQVIFIRQSVSEKTQIALFSATFPEQVNRFAQAVCPKSYELRVETKQLQQANIAQVFFLCNNELQKYRVLTTLYGVLDVGQTIIFVGSVEQSKELHTMMTRDHFSVSLLHGKDMSNTEREKVMDAFRNGQTNVLITTNVLSRGIDVPAVTMVVNYDIPKNAQGSADFEAYTHRIGRAGRFGKRGIAINFVHDRASFGRLGQISKLSGQKIEQLAYQAPQELQQKLHKLLDLE